ncbi:hypothetical protein Pure05_00100 [Paenarthrobacter ureafaciens]|nr:hypothetical protein Pure01_10270 [Paenarthrobacter ureafaciens]GLU71643.1 hypothetical protein Pure04_13580 [Paenarthrobacter ureafaciens]GLU74570.1 hypothetical protein Pure05_00100 [Paenarthrobacter ureafaciens]
MPNSTPVVVSLRTGLATVPPPLPPVPAPSLPGAVVVGWVEAVEAAEICSGVDTMCPTSLPPAIFRNIDSELRKSCDSCHMGGRG